VKSQNMVKSIWSDMKSENGSTNKSVPKVHFDGNDTPLKQTTKNPSMTKKRRKNSPMMMNDYLF
ncbi:hypothetical protein DPMN_060604, partial [Dreissena polymorpha]